MNGSAISSDEDNMKVRNSRRVTVEYVNRSCYWNCRNF